MGNLGIGILCLQETHCDGPLGARKGDDGSARRASRGRPSATSGARRRTRPSWRALGRSQGAHRPPAGSHKPGHAQTAARPSPAASRTPNPHQPRIRLGAVGDDRAQLRPPHRQCSAFEDPAWAGWSPSQSHQETSAHWLWATRSGAWWHARSRSSSAQSSNARARHSSSRSAPRLGRKRSCGWCARPPKATPRLPS